MLEVLPCFLSVIDCNLSAEINHFLISIVFGQNFFFSVDRKWSPIFSTYFFHLTNLSIFLSITDEIEPSWLALGATHISLACLFSSMKSLRSSFCLCNSILVNKISTILKTETRNEDKCGFFLCFCELRRIRGMEMSYWQKMEIYLWHIPCYVKNITKKKLSYFTDTNISMMKK